MDRPNSTDDVIVDENDPTDDVIVDEGTEESTGSSPDPKDVNSEVDESGVSYQNRYLESQRKFENLQKSIPQMIQEGVAAALQNHKPAPESANQPTVADYQAAIVRDPANRDFYMMKIQDIRDAELKRTISTEVQKVRVETEQKQKEQSAVAWAVENFPQLKDPNNPFSQAVVQVFNSRPVDKREPYDFALAAEIVASRMGIRSAAQAKPTDDKLNKVNREVKKLTKQVSIEGGGRNAPVVNNVNQRQKDLKAALDQGNTAPFFMKYYIKENKG